MVVQRSYRRSGSMIALVALVGVLGIVPSSAQELGDLPPHDHSAHSHGEDNSSAELLHVNPTITINGEQLPVIPGIAGPAMESRAPDHDGSYNSQAEPDQSAMLLPPIDGGSTSAPAASRPQTREPSGTVDRVTSPEPQVRPIMVSATVDYAGQKAPLIFPEGSLPYKFYVERTLANRFDLATVVGAVRQWDGIAGSRWSAQHIGTIEERVAAAVADGRSVIFFKSDCPAGVGGYAYWQTGTGAADARYGDAAIYINEVDIGICPAVTNIDSLRAVLAHEIGHAIGMEHLCDAGQQCWKEGMGAGPHGCRVMYASSSSCRRVIAEPERSAAIHNYPRVQRLSGPSRIETAARSSFAGFKPRGAATVIMVRADRTAHGPLAAAALSGVMRGGFLLAMPHETNCIIGAAAEELARVAADPGKVILVGDWPASCDRVLGAWNLTVERVGTSADPITMSVQVATRGTASARGSSVFVVSVNADPTGHVPDGVAAGAAAGANSAPILYTTPDRLAAPVTSWLRAQSGLRRAYVMGGAGAISDQVVRDLRGLGLDVVRLSGGNRVGTALALASRTELFPTGKPVVFATSDSWADAVTGSATGGRLGAPVLVTPPLGDAGIESWLRVRAPQGGLMVGGQRALPYELQWRYSALVR